MRKRFPRKPFRKVRNEVKSSDYDTFDDPWEDYDREVIEGGNDKVEEEK